MTSTKRDPLGPCSPGEHLREELKARGWTPHDLAVRMALADVSVHELAVEMLMAISNKKLIVDAEFSRLLGLALGVSKGLFESLSRSWSKGGKE